MITDDAAGDRSWDNIYNDLDPDQIETLADTQQHRYVDLEIVQADKDGTFSFTTEAFKSLSRD